MSEKQIDAQEIKDWLDNQSNFSLEMKAVSHLATLNYEVEHGGTYSDPVTDRPRQFDIRCVTRNNYRAIKIAAECKALSVEFPLVIQRVPRTEKESFHDVFYAHEPRSDTFGVTSYFDNSSIQSTNLGSPIYPVGQFVGKSSNQIGRKSGKLIGNDTDIYDKWAQAISSAHDLATECAYERERLGFDETLTVIFPILVVSDGCLWCVDYDTNGHRIKEPERVDAVEFYIAKEFWSKGQQCAIYTSSHLKILTYSGFEHFTGRLASNMLYWNNVVFHQDSLKLKEQ